MQGFKYVSRRLLVAKSPTVKRCNGIGLFASAAIKHLQKFTIRIKFLICCGRTIVVKLQ